MHFCSSFRACSKQVSPRLFHSEKSKSGRQSLFEGLLNSVLVYMSMGGVSLSLAGTPPPSPPPLLSDVFAQSANMESARTKDINIAPIRSSWPKNSDSPLRSTSPAGDEEIFTSVFVLSFESDNKDENDLIGGGDVDNNGRIEGRGSLHMYPSRIPDHLHKRMEETIHKHPESIHGSVIDHTEGLVHDIADESTVDEVVDYHGSEHGSRSDSISVSIPASRTALIESSEEASELEMIPGPVVKTPYSASRTDSPDINVVIKTANGTPENIGSQPREIEPEDDIALDDLFPLSPVVIIKDGNDENEPLLSQSASIHREYEDGSPFSSLVVINKDDEDNYPLSPAVSVLRDVEDDSRLSTPVPTNSDDAGNNSLRQGTPEQDSYKSDAPKSNELASEVKECAGQYSIVPSSPDEEIPLEKSPEPVPEKQEIVEQAVAKLESVEQEAAEQQEAVKYERSPVPELVRDEPAIEESQFPAAQDSQSSDESIPAVTEPEKVPAKKIVVVKKRGAAQKEPKKRVMVRRVVAKKTEPKEPALEVTQQVAALAESEEGEPQDTESIGSEPAVTKSQKTEPKKAESKEPAPEVTQQVAALAEPEEGEPQNTESLDPEPAVTKPKKVGAKKAAPKKAAPKKTAPKKTAPKKTALKRDDPEKAESKEPAPEVTQQVAALAESEESEPQNTESLDPEPAVTKPKKAGAAPKKAAPKKTAPKKTALKKDDPEKAESKEPAPEVTQQVAALAKSEESEPQNTESLDPEPAVTKPKKAGAKKAAPKKTAPKKTALKKDDPEKAESKEPAPEMTQQVAALAEPEESEPQNTESLDPEPAVTKPKKAGAKKAAHKKPLKRLH